MNKVTKETVAEMMEDLFGYELLVEVASNHGLDKILEADEEGKLSAADDKISYVFENVDHKTIAEVIAYQEEVAEAFSLISKAAEILMKYNRRIDNSLDFVLGEFNSNTTFDAPRVIVEAIEATL